MRLSILMLAVVSLGLVLANFKSDSDKCLKYLIKYEWIQDPKLKSPSKKQLSSLMKSPLKKLQKVYNLEKTALCDKQTLAFMSKPRCGNSDAAASGIHNISNNGTLVRKKRWARIEGVPVWDDPDFGFSFPITIGFKNYHPSMTQGAQDEALLYCATRWAEQSGLSFSLVFGQPTANIYISFIPAIENDGGAFGVLAMAESPTPFRTPPESTVEFDSREPWVAKFTPNQPGDTISFQAVLCHEMGHSLALDHTTDSTAVMFGELLDQNSEVMLAQDDITGIQTLYGPPNGIVIVNAQPAPQPMPPAPTAAPVGPTPAPVVPTAAPVVPTPFPTVPAVTDDPRGRFGTTAFPQPRPRGRERCADLRTRRQRQACFDRTRPRRGRAGPARRAPRRNSPKRNRGRNGHGGRQSGRFRGRPRGGTFG